MLIKSGSISIPEHSGQRIADLTAEVTFDQPVNEAHVALTGFRAEYTGGKDEEVRILKVTVSPVVTSQPSRTVTVRCQLWLADKGNDNKFNGSIYFLVFANAVGTVPLPTSQT